ncbi:hypothetical protein GC173_17100 [bacterium]|nr:hypothetical protein [bacterium]
MKKVLIGCGIVFLLMVLVCSGVTIWGYLTVQSVGKNYQAAITRVDGVSKKLPYTPSPDGKLTEEQLERYFAMRDFITNDLKSAPLVAKIVEAQDKKTQPNIGMAEILSFAAKYPPELMNRTADEMEKRQMGPQEYYHTGRLIYATIEQGKATGTEVMTEIYDKMETAVDQINSELSKSGQNQDARVDFIRTMSDLNVEGELPVSNFETLSGYKDRILEFPQYTFFEFLILKKMGEQGNYPPAFKVEKPE